MGLRLKRVKDAGGFYDGTVASAAMEMHEVLGCLDVIPG